MKISNSPDISEYAAAGLQTVAMKDSHHFHVFLFVAWKFRSRRTLGDFYAEPERVGREKLDRMQNWPFARGQESLQRFTETRRRPTGQRWLRLRFLVRRRRLTFRSVVVARVSVFYSGADIDPTATTWRCRPVITLCAVFLHVADEILCIRHTTWDPRSKIHAPRLPNARARPTRDCNTDREWIKLGHWTNFLGSAVERVALLSPDEMKREFDIDLSKFCTVELYIFKVSLTWIRIFCCSKAKNYIILLKILNVSFI